MSPPVHKPTRVQYRHVNQDAALTPAFNLQTALSACVANPATNTATLRKLEMPDYGTLLLNGNTAHRDYFFGEIVRIEPGQNLELLEAQEDSNGVFNLLQAAPPGGRNVLKGVFYFMVVRNHVMLIEGDVPASRVERFLTHLLKTLSRHLNHDGQIILEAELRVDGGTRLPSINEITLKPNRVEHLQTPTGDDLVVDSGRFAGNQAMAILVSAGIDPTDIQQLTENDAYFELSLNIKYKRGRKKNLMSSDSARVLLRNLPEDQELILDGPLGKEKDGRIVKLSFSTMVLRQGALYVYNDVARALNDAYLDFLQSGRIE